MSAVQKNPRVSIIIAIGSDTGALRSCFRSLQRQSMNDFEVIMVTCRASKEDLAIAREFTDSDLRFHLHRLNAPRINIARNYGLQQASGDWVVFVEPSDVLAAKCLETALLRAEENHADGVSWNGFMMKNSEVRMASGSEGKPVVFDTITDKETMITDLYIPRETSIPYGVFMRSCKGKLLKREILAENEIRLVSQMRYNQNLLFLSQFLLCAGPIVVTGDYLQRSLFREESEQISYLPDLMNIQTHMFDEIRKTLLPLNIPFRKIEYMFWSSHEHDFIRNWMSGPIPWSQGINITRIYLNYPVISESLTNGRGKSRAERYRTWLLKHHFGLFAAINDIAAVLGDNRQRRIEESFRDKPSYDLDNISLQQLIHETSNVDQIEKDNQTSRPETTALDYSYPFEELYMVKYSGMPREEPPLPAGFYWSSRPELLKMQWINGLRYLGFVSSYEAASEEWEKMVRQDEDYFYSHLYALVSETGTLAAVVGIWPCSEIPGNMRLHWMMTNATYQRRGFGRLVIRKALYEYAREYPGQPIYLSTQAQSWPAIRLYESEGFLSYEGQTVSVPEDENRRRWQRARKSVKERENVAI